MKIAVLGEGITGAAVKSVVDRLLGYELVPVSSADLIVTSPGIPPSEYPESQVEIVSEIEFAFRLFHRVESSYTPKLIGITGTNGKSTVTACLSHLLEVPYAGNIGVPLIHFVDDPTQPEYLVVELSSYQLEGCSTFRPEVSVLLNITEDHLGRHRSMAEYGKTKARIFQNQVEEDVLIYPNLGGITGEIGSMATNARCIDPFARSSLFESQTTLKGPHNQLNCLVIEAVLAAISVPLESVISRMASFKGLPYRLESVREILGRLIVNDSKSTNTDSTMRAVESFEAPVHLILCGEDKGLDWATFYHEVKDKVASLTILGGLKAPFQQLVTDAGPPLYYVDSLLDSLQAAYDQSKSGDVILFSPGGSSFDMFKDFVDRGEKFNQVVDIFSDQLERLHHA